MLDTIERVTGQQTQRNYLPGRAFDVPVSQLCIERARAELEWEPVIHFEDGIRRFARWIEADELEGAR